MTSGDETELVLLRRWLLVGVGEVGVDEFRWVRDGSGGGSSHKPVSATICCTTTTATRPDSSKTAIVVVKTAKIANGTDISTKIKGAITFIGFQRSLLYIVDSADWRAVKSRCRVVVDVRLRMTAAGTPRTGTWSRGAVQHWGQRLVSSNSSASAFGLSELF